MAIAAGTPGRGFVFACACFGTTGIRGSGLERTETLPVELTGGTCEVGGWGGEVVSVGGGGGGRFE